MYWTDITCDGCQGGFTMGRDVDPGAFIRERGWVQVDEKHFCSLCVARGKATEQMELKDV